MSARINVIICPKDELGFNSTIIRAKFNDLANILEKHDFKLTQYLDSVDIASGSVPTNEFEPLASDIAPHGFTLDIEKILRAI